MNPNNQYADPVLIVSPARSGSSLTAHMLVSNGLFAGDTKPADRYNQKGYWENIAVTNLLVDYLRRNDKHQQGKRFHPPYLNADYPDFRNKVLTAMSTEGLEPGQQWMFKNPKTAICWRLWARHFPEAKWVLLDRDRNELLQSLDRTPFMDAYDNFEGWNYYVDRYQHYMSEIATYCNSYRLDMRIIVNQDDYALRGLWKFLGIKNGQPADFNHLLWNE